MVVIVHPLLKLTTMFRYPLDTKRLACLRLKATIRLVSILKM